MKTRCVRLFTFLFFPGLALAPPSCTAHAQKTKIDTSYWTYYGSNSFADYYARASDVKAGNPKDARVQIVVYADFKGPNRDYPGATHHIMITQTNCQTGRYRVTSSKIFAGERTVAADFWPTPYVQPTGTGVALFKLACPGR